MPQTPEPPCSGQLPGLESTIALHSTEKPRLTWHQGPQRNQITSATVHLSLTLKFLSDASALLNRSHIGTEVLVVWVPGSAFSPAPKDLEHKKPRWQWWGGQGWGMTGLSRVVFNMCSQPIHHNLHVHPHFLFLDFHENIIKWCHQTQGRMSIK